jgi:hypothetical protein
VKHRIQTVRKTIVVAALVALTGLAVAAPLQSASAQGLFDFLFGGGPRRSSPPPAAPGSPPPSGPVSRGDDTGPNITRVPGGDTGRSVAYCVRTCDGRYFPLQRVAGSTPAEACNAFCPAAQTKVYNGSLIDHAVASDGTRYTSLKTAFLYRDKQVEGCTCNGKDPYGLARIEPKADPTLRPGDIVATRDGLQAYTGNRNGQNASFSPATAYSGLSADMRQQLANTRISPPPAKAASAPGFDAEPGKQAVETFGAAPRDENRRIQVR